MLNYYDRSFIIFLVNRTRDRRFKKLASKMSDNRKFFLPFQKDKFEKIFQARKIFESRVLEKMRSDSQFAQDFIDQVGSMSIMSCDYAMLQRMVHSLHAAAISQLSASAADSALDEILGEI